MFPDVYSVYFGAGKGTEVREIYRPVTPEAASSSLVTPATPKAPLSIHCPIH